MLDVILFLGMIFTLASTVVQFLGIACKNIKFQRFANIILWVSFIVLTCYLIVRGVISRRLPLSNQFEFGIAFTWGVMLFYLMIQVKFKFLWLGNAVLPIVFLLYSYMILQPREIGELMPSLRSSWFGLHIGSAVFAYSAFVLAACFSLIYLYNLKNQKLSAAQMNYIDFISYRLIAFGLLMLTVVILSGCVWAEQAWSTFWSWDPKETWALITWIIYVVYLHQRLYKRQQVKTLALYSFIAVFFVLFTFIGVNTLMEGLHSYK